MTISTIETGDRPADGVRARTRGTTGRKQTTPPETLLRIVLETLDDLQAEEIATIDLRGKSSMCDYMVVATGRSQRHVVSTADHLLEALKPACPRTPAVEGLPHGDWVLVDAGDVIVHLFRAEVRSFYNLEKMWGADLDMDGRAEQVGH